ncbi:hypothetical protein GEV33_006392 [Tenebrio molitor]|uniref:Uncharacterized protein n=1 Tax=Tenebrio molitor TaxID=7067 RepID=A0A8J6LBX3_TENMO|nr:hypothetical protein GEV33_006392 [Tenebrio molitor]
MCLSSCLSVSTSRTRRRSRRPPLGRVQTTSTEHVRVFPKVVEWEIVAKRCGRFSGPSHGRFRKNRKPGWRICFLPSAPRGRAHSTEEDHLQSSPGNVRSTPYLAFPG